MRSCARSGTKSAPSRRHANSRTGGRITEILARWRGATIRRCHIVSFNHEWVVTRECANGITEVLNNGCKENGMYTIKSTLALITLFDIVSACAQCGARKT